MQWAERTAIQGKSRNEQKELQCKVNCSLSWTNWVPLACYTHCSQQWKATFGRMPFFVANNDWVPILKTSGSTRIALFNVRFYTAPDCIMQHQVYAAPGLHYPTLGLWSTRIALCNVRFMQYQNCIMRHYVYTGPALHYATLGSCTESELGVLISVESRNGGFDHTIYSDILCSWFYHSCYLRGAVDG